MHFKLDNFSFNINSSHSFQDVLYLPLQVGVAVYRRFDTEDSASAAPPLSYLAHISGSLAGVTIGLVILNNFQQKLWERQDLTYKRSLDKTYFTAFQMDLVDSAVFLLCLCNGNICGQYYYVVRKYITL